MYFRFLVFLLVLAFCQGQNDHEGHNKADDVTIVDPDHEVHHEALNSTKFSLRCHCHHRYTLSWSKDGKALTKGGRYDIVVTERPDNMRDITLIVSGKMSKADNGRYRCSAAGGKGEDEIKIVIGDHSSATTSGVSVVLATVTLLAAALLR